MQLNMTNANPPSRDALRRRRPLLLAHLTLLHVPPPDLVNIAARAGYDGVSLLVSPPSPNDRAAVSYPMLGTESAMMREVLARLHGSDIAVHDVQGFRLKPDTRVADFLPMLEAGGRLGASYAMAVSDDPDERRNADRLAELADNAGRFGMRVAIEFMAYSGIRSIRQTNHVLDLAGRRDIVMMLDALHLVRSGGTLDDVVSTDPARIPYLQICDAPVAPPAEQGGLAFEARKERLFPGWGGLPLRDLIRVLPQAIPLSVETPVTSLHGRYTDLQIAQMALDATRNLCNQAEVMQADS
jgi:sugar phosphate isomerase/epimerase